MCRYLKDSIQNEQRNPLKTFLERVRFINRNKSYLYEPMTVEAVDAINPDLAFRFFNECYKNPSQFTVCITGSIEVPTSLKHSLLVCSWSLMSAKC